VIVYRLIVYRHRTVAEVLLSHPAYLVVLAVAAVSLRYRRPLLDWIDRRFFRQSYVQEQVLLRLIEEVARQSTVEGVARLLSEQLEAALHPSSVTVLVSRAERGDLETAYSSTGAGERTPLTRGRSLYQRLDGGLDPVDVDPPLHARLDADESAWLRDRDASLLVPLAGSEEDVIGLLVLGPKLSEEPYSPEDRRLLQALGRQAAMTVENLLLRDKVSREAGMRREVIDRIERDRLPLLRECPRCGACFDAGGLCPDDGEELILTLPVERTLDDRYRLDRRLGQGGMGSVFRAWDLRLRRAVAAKVLMGRYFGDAVALRRLRREARAAAALSHPNIVPVHDYGTAGPDGAYLVMELVEGPTLRERLRSGGRLDPRTAGAFLDQLLRALGAAHGAGLVHRDVKPANVLIATADGGAEVLKLGDFGIAKLRLEGDEAATVLTEAGALVGTVRYMAPEQLTGGAVDHRADLWSAGILAVEMLTGEHPFPGRSPAEILTGALSAPIRLSDGGGEGDTGPLEAVLCRALAPDPDDRYATAEAFRAELREALARCPDGVALEARAVPGVVREPPAEGAATL
jgi:tRNA A-37 threonylcarbamoyl transferase component Bud32/GAF domain-containing protein